MDKGQDGVIIKATKKELYSKYINEEYFDRFSFGEFLAICKLNGIEIIFEEEVK